MKELLDLYYTGLAKKEGWEGALAESFQFTGGDMLNSKPIVGKNAYIEVIKRFSRLFVDVRPADMIIEGGKAYVTANYDYVFPGGKAVNGNVAEIWTSEGGKLTSLTIFFDTLSFNKLTQ
jgi:ketosteroid isomerase-like protein